MPRLYLRFFYLLSGSQPSARRRAADQEIVQDHRRRPQVCSSSSSPGAGTSSSLPLLLPLFFFLLLIFPFLPEHEQLGHFNLSFFKPAKRRRFVAARTRKHVGFFFLKPHVKTTSFRAARVQNGVVLNK